MPFMETVTGAYVHITREDVERMTRHQLIEFLESRGTACYDDETTKDLRECAFQDVECEEG